MISLTFPFSPVPKARPRSFIQGKRIVVTSAPKTRQFESDMRLWAQKQMVGKTPLEGPLRVTARFFLARPKSVKREHPTVKPDLDNFLKCLDALNGICWVDDAQVVHFDAQKLYAMDDAGPRISVLIQEYK